MLKIKDSNSDNVRLKQMSNHIFSRQPDHLTYCKDLQTESTVTAKRNLSSSKRFTFHFQSLSYSFENIVLGGIPVYGLEFTGD